MQVYCSGATARKSQGKKNAWKALIKTEQNKLRTPNEGLNF